jgi:histidinol-phosphate aminotransferase
MMPVFGVLARFKGLRGTPLDPFGYTRERKGERALRDRYLAFVREPGDQPARGQQGGGAQAGAAAGPGARLWPHQAGGHDILEIAAHAFVERGQSIVYSQYSFAVYALATQGVGANHIVVPAKAYGHDLPAMLAAIKDDTRLVFIANPNNPTGTFIPAADIQAFLDQVPANVVVVLDEAYNEFLAEENQFESAEWGKKHPNLLVSRTFSKAYGLAGLRVGFGIAQPALTDLMNRIRQPFNVNSLAQAAAIAALNDKEFLKRSAANNAAGYQQFTEAFDQLGLEYVPSYGNFVLVKVGKDLAAGARVNLSLLKQGVIVRPVGNYGLPEWLRISIGLPQENLMLITALAKALSEQS